MIASVPSFAFAFAPDTGASISETPRLRRSAPSARVSAGSEELMSMTRLPRRKTGRAARTTLPTTFPSGSIVIRMSVPSAAERTV